MSASNGTTDLGDGKMQLKAGDAAFAIDGCAWVRWLALEAPPGHLYVVLDAAKAKLLAEGGPALNDSQAESLLHAVSMEAEAKKKQRASELTSLRSSA